MINPTDRSTAEVTGPSQATQAGRLVFHAARTGAETTAAETTGVTEAGTGAETTVAGIVAETTVAGTEAETSVAENEIEAGTEEETQTCEEEEICASAEEDVPNLHAAAAGGIETETTERRRQLVDCQPPRIIDLPPRRLRSSWANSPTKSRRSCRCYRTDQPLSKTPCASSSSREGVSGAMRAATRTTRNTL